MRLPLTFLMWLFRLFIACATQCDAICFRPRHPSRKSSTSSWQYRRLSALCFYFKLPVQSWMFCERPYKVLVLCVLNNAMQWLNELRLSSSSVYAPLSLDFTCPCILIYAPSPDFRWLSHMNLQDFHHNCCTNAAFSPQVTCHDWIDTRGLQEVPSNNILINP